MHKLIIIDKVHAMRVLISNDDGIMSRGIHVLAEAMSKVAEVTVVAPSQERSTMSHSLTLHKPLRIQQMKERYYHVNGTPADCVYLGLKRICKEFKPDLVLSGINRGANLGYDVHYSGTVAAAREAAMMKVPSMAISLFIKGQEDPNQMNFETAAHYAQKITSEMVKNSLPHGVFLNVNVPDLSLKDIKGLKIVPTGVRIYSDKVEEKTDPRGKNYYWLGGGYIGFENKENTDCYVVEEGFVSLTPLHIDATEHTVLPILENWKLEQDV